MIGSHRLPGGEDLPDEEVVAELDGVAEAGPGREPERETSGVRSHRINREEAGAVPGVGSSEILEEVGLEVTVVVEGGVGGVAGIQAVVSFP